LIKILRLLSLLLLIYAAVSTLRGQTGCPSVNILSSNGESSIEIDCDEPCVSLDANPFETGSTTSYTVGSIPYNPPYPFNLGTQLFIGIDDVYSGAINLPFDFCFFGNSFNQIAVCSNGSISFNPGSANQYCPWAFTAAVPSANLPVNSIFGVYHDIDPSVCGQVRYQVLGAQPCRTFVLSYNAVCHFSCNSLQSTTQIVLYETTNAIDVYVLNKPTCGGWNGGRAVIGIQNAAGNIGFTPPGRNTGNWSTNNEAWRFTPSGGEPTYSVSWYADGNLVGTGNTLDVCPSETTTYTAEGTYTGCGGTVVVVDDEFTVTVNTLIEDVPNPTITNTQDLCISQGSFQFEAIDVGGVWDASCGACINQNGLFDIVAAGSGPHWVSQTLDGECGPITSTVDFNLIQDPDPSITPAGPFCSSDVAFTLVAAQAGGSWSADCGACIDALTGTFSPQIAGPGTFTVTYQHAGTCPTSATSEIEVIAQTIADFTIPAEVCENAGAVTPAASQAGGSWSATCVNCITANGIFSPEAAGGGTFTITHAFTEACPDTYAVDIVVIPVTEPVITAVPDLCNSGDPITLSVNAPGGSWSANCSNCITTNGVFDPFGLTAGWYSVNYTIPGQCPVSDDAEVEIVQQPSAEVNDPGILCTGEGNVLLTTVDPGGVYTASCGNCINGVNGSFDPVMAGPGQHTITYSIGGLCPDQQQLTITVEQSADATLQPVGSYCVGWGDVQITAADEGGLFTANCGDCIDSQTGIFTTTGLTPGQYTVTYTLAGFCGDTDQINVIVIPNDDSTITADPGYCINAGGQQFTAAEPGGVWSADCGNCLSSTGVFSPISAGVGSHVVTYSIPGVCGTTSTHTVNVYPLPVPTFTTNTITGCIPFTAEFVQDSLQNTFCQWSFGDGTFGTSCGTAVHTFTEPGCYNIGLSLNSYQGCTSSIQYNNMVCALPLPTSGFVYTPVFPTTDNPFIELQEQTEGAISWDWYTMGQLIGSGPTLDYNLLDHGGNDVQVCLRVTDTNGCVDSFCRTIDLIEKLRVFVPNVFTPDQDGVNEVWMPVVVGAVEYEVQVFNRWGQSVFHSNTPGEPWLGEVNGGEYFSPNGVYVWTLKVTAEDLEVHESTGHVILMR
jgi:gliding motility-associated-like protein